MVGSSRLRGYPSDDFALWVRPNLRVIYRASVMAVGFVHAEDLMQEVTTRAWRKLHTYDPRRGAPSTWLTAIVKDCAGPYRRRLMKQEGIFDADPWQRSSPVQPSETDIALRDAISKLPPKQRAAIFLYYYVGLSVEDIASALGCSSGTVKSNLFDGRSRLRSMLEGSVP